MRQGDGAALKLDMGPNVIVDTVNYIFLSLDEYIVIKHNRVISNILRIQTLSSGYI